MTLISFQVMLNALMNPKRLSRKNFIKLLGLGVTSVGFRPILDVKHETTFPNYERLGRVCVGKVDIKSTPFDGSQTIGSLYEDAIIPWFREVVAKEFNIYRFNQRWVETTDGYIYASYVQPVRNILNQPINTLFPTSMGEGVWAEVTVPYADITLVNGPSSNSWASVRVNEGLPLRVYYKQVFYIDHIKTDISGNTYYRANPNYYGGVDMFWVPAEAMRPILPEEITAINPDVEDKKVVVDVTRQSLSCYEGDSEVYFCRVSTGGKWDYIGNSVDKWSTPLGLFKISPKYISLQMSGGTTGASYDLPGIGWVSIFATGGVAIHATVWHNDFGAPKSHGCVNAMPDDAKWIFRWSLPQTPYDPGKVDISVSGEKSTTVQVIES